MTQQEKHTAGAGSVLCWDGTGKEVPEADAAPTVILICEHASAKLSGAWSDAAADVLSSHAASDLGALGLAKALGPELAQVCGGAELVYAPLSRLIYDLNRSPDRPDAVPARSEIHSIPMNAAVTAKDKLARVTQLYLPFHSRVQARIVRAMALGRRPVILTVHSFTPVWHGVPRAVEFGVIHDDTPQLARQIVAEAAPLGLVTMLNEPYSAADHVTHTLRLHALPYRLDNAMLELRNDLIATPAAQTAMAGKLAPVLARAMAAVTELSCRAS